MSQVQQDLENLLGEVDAGWSNSGGKGRPMISIGVGGCMLIGMQRAVGIPDGTALHPASPEQNLRIDAMHAALGFRAWCEMYEWNDRQTDPNQIKLRIKDALNTL